MRGGLRSSRLLSAVCLPPRCRGRGGDASLRPRGGGVPGAAAGVFLPLRAAGRLGARPGLPAPALPLPRRRPPAGGGGAAGARGLSRGRQVSRGLRLWVVGAGEQQVVRGACGRPVGCGECQWFVCRGCRQAPGRGQLSAARALGRLLSLLRY